MFGQPIEAAACSAKNMSDESPKPLDAERKEKQITQQPVDDEAAQNRAPLAPDCMPAQASAATQSRMGTSETCVIPI